MEIDFSIVIPNLVVLGIMIIFLLISMRKSYLQILPFKYFILTIVFGFFYSIIVVIYGLNIFSGEIFNIVLQNLYITISGLQIITFFIFFEELTRFQVSKWRSLIVFFLFIIQSFGSWFILLYYNMSNEITRINQGFNVLDAVGYNLLALFVYGICGLPIVIKMYRYTKEKKALVLVFAINFIITGYLITLIFDLLKIFHELTNYQNIIKQIGDGLPVIGFFMILIIYLIDINYIYRTPFDHYLIQVFDKKSGLILSQMRFQTKNNNIHISEKVFSRFISAINSLHSNIFNHNSKSTIQQINSGDVSILIENGNYIGAILVTERISRNIQRCLEKFVKKYEKKFDDEIKLNKPMVKNLTDGKKIFSEIFPYLKEVPIET